MIEEISSYVECNAAYQVFMGEDIEIFEPTFNTNDFFSNQFSAYNSTRQKSDVQSLVEFAESRRNGVLMYYAEP